jgi:hypothetical protein
MHNLKKSFGSVAVILLLTLVGLAFTGCKEESSTQPSLGDANWHEVGKPGQPPFQDSWENLDTTSYSTCAFRKDGQNMVYLKGTITGGGVDSTIFTLPVGYRPSQLLMFDPYGGTYNSEITVYPDGRVRKGPNYNSFACLDGIVFHADH